MKKFLSKSLLYIFCGLALILSLRGLPGNPKASELSSNSWKTQGPLEQSNEGGRFALAYAIVENHTFQISPDLAKISTPDLGFRNGKYYSLFAPGVAFISMPGFLIGRFFGSLQVGSFLTITLFAILNVYLIRKIAIKLGANPTAASLAAFAFLFASPAFAYSTTLYEHHISTFFILLSVDLLISYDSLWSLAAIWLLYAASFIVDYPNLIMMFPIAVFALGKAIHFKKRSNTLGVKISLKKIATAFVVIIPILLLGWYNITANGSFTKLSGTLDRVIDVKQNGKPLLGSEQLKEAIKEKKITTIPNSSLLTPFKTRNMINGLYEHLFSQDRGMIFFTPVMIFGIIGIYFASKNWNKYIGLLLGVLSFNVILYSMWDDPYGGWAFGSRYLIPAYAILSIFIAFLLTKIKKKDILLVAFFITLAYSISVNALGALTSNSIPPKGEALSLQKQYHTEQIYTYLRDVDLLNQDQSKALVFQSFASNYITAWSYYKDLVAFIILTSGFLLLYFKLSENPNPMHFAKQVSSKKAYELSYVIPFKTFQKFKIIAEKRIILIIFLVLSAVSVISFIYYYLNGLGLAYNDARSHLDIGRRVVENLKPGFAQLGSVWLPLPHLIMTLTIWNNFMWHSGLAGALEGMVSYVATGVLIYLILKKLDVNLFGRIVGVIIFAFNLNILYMQSTAMTELPLIATMMAGIYELINWHYEEKIFSLIKSAFWIMLATLIRYDGWFLFAFSSFLVFYRTLRKYGFRTAEGKLVIFVTLSGFGIFLWFFWNLMIFKDPLYFAFGSFSASAQQQVIAQTGALITKKNLFYSTISYLYALVYNSDIVTVLVSLAGALLFYFDKKIDKSKRIAALCLLSPLMFNIIALYFGQSVLFVQGLGSNIWFNVRYGLLMIPSFAIFIGYLLSRVEKPKLLLMGMMAFVMFFQIANSEVVTLDDAVVGKGGKNVSEVSDYLKDYATNKEGFVLLSVSKQDAIVFSSGLPMKRFIHEGTGKYWDLATAHPEKWARWIVLGINDPTDPVTSLVRDNKAFKNDYTRVRNYEFADVYELKPAYLSGLHNSAKLAAK